MFRVSGVKLFQRRPSMQESETAKCNAVRQPDDFIAEHM